MPMLLKVRLSCSFSFDMKEKSRLCYVPVLVSRFGRHVSHLLWHPRCAGYASLLPHSALAVARCAMLWHVVPRQMNVAERVGQNVTLWLGHKEDGYVIQVEYYLAFISNYYYTFTLFNYSFWKRGLALHNVTQRHSSIILCWSLWKRGSTLHNDTFSSAIWTGCLYIENCNLETRISGCLMEIAA